MVLYFPPSYFPTSFFGGLAPRPTAGSGRDRDAFAALLGALETTGEFAAVALAPPPGRDALPADRWPRVLLAPDGWEEAPDATPGTALRRVRFTLTLAARDVDPAARLDRLDRLGNLVQNVLSGSDLGGACLPGMTRIGRGSFDPGSRHPELRLVLAGRFAYPIASPSGRDTTP